MFMIGRDLTILWRYNSWKKIKLMQISYTIKYIFVNEISFRISDYMLAKCPPVIRSNVWLIILNHILLVF